MSGCTYADKLRPEVSPPNTIRSASLVSGVADRDPTLLLCDARSCFKELTSDRYAEIRRGALRRIEVQG